MTTKKTFFALILSAMLCVPMSLSAQVVIGSGRAPSEWSLLDLCTDYQRKALHNARMTYGQRNNLMNETRPQAERLAARGLLIFRTDAIEISPNEYIGCLEFWNGMEWISLCADRLPLNPTPSDNIHATTLANVMYDFQAQPLQFFYESAAQPASWQWQWSHTGNNNNNADWTNIAGAAGTGSAQSGAFWHASWLLPANFIHNVVLPIMADRQGNLYFRAVVVDENDVFASNTIQIRFIQTTATGNNDFLQGFGMGADGVRYAILERAPQASPATGSTIRVALLNVGANDFDGGLGGLFQWGRRADEHQLIGWHNDPLTRNTTFITGESNGVVTTSGIIPAWVPITAQGQPVTPNPNFIRVFGGMGCWTAPVYAAGTSVNNLLPPSRDLWGNGTTTNANNVSQANSVTRATAPIISTAWRFTANNPCPDGWRVPSQWEWFDMASGDGVGNPSGTAYGAWGNRQWTQRDTNAGAVGGAIVRNTTNDAAIFLPAAGMRNPDGTSVQITGSFRTGRYWSSTQHNGDEAGLLTINTHANHISVAGGMRFLGASVRCVRD